MSFTVVDLFCGAGGASEAFRRAADGAGLDYEMLAINHWTTAIETHRLNHPRVVHLCEPIDHVQPQREVFKDTATGREFRHRGRVNLLMAGPECIFHSRARGAKPINDQKRSSAWRVIDWLSALYVDNVLIENVPEFQEWGPLGANGRPLKTRRGETFRAFIEAIRSLDYKVEYKVVCAADFGDPTTRERLFIMARRGRRAIEWPAPTHSQSGGRSLLRKTKKWRSAREDVIDWTIQSRSIFDPNRSPIAPKTFQRILAGLQKFGGKELEPFLVILRNNADAQSIDKPIPTVAAQGNHIGLVQPEPMVIAQGQGGVARPVSQPVPTIPGKGAHQLIEPFLVPHYGERLGQKPRVHSVDAPLPTVPATGGGKFEIAQPFIVPPRGFSQDAKVDSVDKPLRTIVAASGHTFAVVEPALKDASFVASYYGTQNICPVSSPLPTVTAKDRFALVMPVVNGRALDIRLRMLQPRELARAHSFGDDYQFSGNKGEQVKQVGNSWPVKLGYALVRTLIREYLPKRKRTAA